MKIVEINKRLKVIEVNTLLNSMLIMAVVNNSNINVYECLGKIIKSNKLTPENLVELIRKQSKDLFNQMEELYKVKR